MVTSVLEWVVLQPQEHVMVISQLVLGGICLIHHRVSLASKYNSSVKYVVPTTNIYASMCYIMQLPPTTLASVQTLESITDNGNPQSIDNALLLISTTLLENNLESIAANANVSSFSVSWLIS